VHKILFLSLALTLVACGDSALSSGGSCDVHKTAADCTADTACKVSGCPTCTQGGVSFDACVAKSANPVIACPAIACASQCQLHTNTPSCVADTTCEASGCSDCKGGTTFNGCYEKGAGPDIVCANVCPIDCAQNIGEATCNAATGCHSVFNKPDPSCKCTGVGCCMQFSSCGNGSAVCEMQNAPPCFAPPPVCDAGFVVSYGSQCPEGCVRATECPQK